MKLKIGDKIIGREEPCFIIAEAGVNHNGSLNLAKKLVDVAKDAGADAVKFQTFESNDLVTIHASVAEYQKKNLENNEKQLNMLKRLELNQDDFKELKEYCDEKKIIFLSTPHTENVIDFLNDLVFAFKISSGDLINFPFLEKIAKKGKPIILATGMANLREINEALETIYSQGNKQVIALHCTTNYPCSLDEVNLRAMQTMQKELDCLVGYSDHTLSIEVPLMAKKLGAFVIEKHYTLDRNMEGPDHKASLEPNELKKMIELLRNPFKKIQFNELVMGSSEKKPTRSELEIMKLMRKSIVAKRDILKDQKIEKNDLIIKRPGIGISPKYLGEIIGRISKIDINKDELIKFEFLK